MKMKINEKAKKEVNVILERRRRKQGGRPIKKKTRLTYLISKAVLTHILACTMIVQ